MEITLALIFGCVSSLLSVLLPYGSSVLNIVITEILCNVCNQSDITKELSLLSSFVIFSLIKSVKEINEPKTSGSEDFTVFGNQANWKCLQIQPFEQVKQLVESRIIGVIAGLAVSYILISMFNFDIGSLPITKLIIIYIIYQTFKNLEFQAYRTKQKLISLIIKTLLYVSIAPICFYVLNIWGCYNPAVIVIYLIFIMPNMVENLTKTKT